MKHLLKPEELRKLGRPIGKVADDKLTAFITEAEQLHIKPILGDKLFLELLDEAEKEDGGEKNEALQLLLNGGTYKVKEGTENESPCSFTGLKVAMSYFVYAQNLMVGDIESTRYGSVIKNGDYSNHVSSKERSDAYNNTLEVANSYLKECVAYCKEKKLIQSAGKATAKIGGVIIKKIG